MIVLLIMTIPFAGLTQLPDSSKLWIPREDALRVLAKAKQAEVLTEILSQKEQDIKVLNDRIAGLNRAISEFSAGDEASQQIILSYKRQIKELEDIIKLHQLDVTVYKKQIKKLKRSKFWTSVAGIAAVAGTIFLMK